MHGWLLTLALAGAAAVPEPNSALAAGCAREGERLTACTTETVAWSGTESVEVVSCVVHGDHEPRQARTALSSKGRRLGCLSLTEPIALADTWSVASKELARDSLGTGRLVYSSRRYAPAKLLVFFGQAYASNFNEVEIWRFVGGTAVQVLPPSMLGLDRLEDVDGDSVPELLTVRLGCQTNCCYNPTVVYRLGAAGFGVDEPASRARAKARGEPWFGPDAADGDASNAYVKDCQERLLERAEDADAAPK